MFRGYTFSRLQVGILIAVSVVWLLFAGGQTKAIRDQMSDQTKLSEQSILNSDITLGSNVSIASTNMGTEPRRTAFVTMLATDSFVPGVLTLWYSLNNTRSINSEKDDFVVLETSSLSNDARQKLETSIPGCIIVRQESLERIDRFSSSEFIDRYQGNRSWMMFSKLNIFDLTQYERVIYMDADILVLRDLSALLHPQATSTNVDDGLFTDAAADFYNGTAPLVACPEKRGLEPEFNAGFLLFRPSHDLYLDLKSHVNDTDYLCGFRATDQSFLCHYFHASRQHESTIRLGSEDLEEPSMGWEALPRSFMSLYKTIKQKKRKPSALWNQSYLLHFNGNKPWLIKEKDRPKMKDRMTRRWLDVAKECGERCYFNEFLNGSMIAAFFSLYNYR